jgi:hypothetical protein
MRSAALLLSVLAASIITSTAMAQSTALAPADGTNIVVPVEESNGVRFMNGGAAEERMIYMKSRTREFSVNVLITAREGAYGVADSLTVSQDGRDLVTIPQAGPLLLLDLKPGRYTLESRFNGVAERRSVNVGQGTTMLHWSTGKLTD